jgi:phospholipid/cholesterol/gamma-HCH transport system permease protein
MLDRTASLGFWFERRLGTLLGMAFLGYRALKGVLVERGRGRRVVVQTIASQIYFTAVEPLPMFLVTALIFGFVVTVEADQILPRVGLIYYVPQVIVVSLVREVSPLIIALVLIGRSGTAIATEIAAMKGNLEVEALDAMGVNIDYYIVFPRLVGVTVASVCVSVAFDATAIVGGYFVGSAAGLVSLTLRLTQVLSALTPEILAYALVKSVAFGATVALSSCHHGLAAGFAPTEIPKANVRSVVTSLLVCFFVNALISVYAIL